jgi:enamine deaminase RidA (YjgF/YER057c/UK114 family)
MGINKQTFRSGPFQDFFAQGVEVGGTLYLAGQIGVDGFGTAEGWTTSLMKRFL